MAQDDAGEKTETATEKRRKEFRDKGEVARSTDITSVLVFFCALAYFIFFGGHLWRGVSGFVRHFFELRSGTELTERMAMEIGSNAVVEMAWTLFPLVAAILTCGILANVGQVGLMFTTKPLEPDLNRLNFFTKFISTFFNKASLGTLVSSITKIAVIGTVVYLTVSGDGQHIRALATLPVASGVAFVIDRCLEVVLNVALVLIVVAVIDYAWNVYVLEERMKMTKQEVRDENKEYGGNPHVKQQQRKRGMEMVNARMMQAVPDADVVVNNPTHISVALRYRDGDAAPIVVAKGADLMAMRIRRVARANGIPMVENVPLARALYRSVKVGRRVPSDFYRAVAEVLAYVYRQRQEGKARTPDAAKRPTPRRDVYTRSSRR
jgi:flagellar biosynthesis protein FlhB